jgi:hypothetical protein
MIIVVLGNNLEEAEEYRDIHYEDSKPGEEKARICF